MNIWKLENSMKMWKLEGSMKTWGTENLIALLWPGYFYETSTYRSKISYKLLESLLDLLSLFSVSRGPVQLAQFTLESVELTNTTFSFSTGSFIQLQVKFNLKRDLLFFILQSYVPSTFIVMCSYVAFWINRDGIPGRACLSITTVLR